MFVRKLSDIRVTYSGLIALVMAAVNIFLGMIFSIIITRTLSPTEYGTWILINSIIFYVIAAEPIISYWATREIARGLQSGKTAIMSSGIFSLGGILCYMIFVYFASDKIHVDHNVLFFGSILITLMFLNRTLIGINLGWKPHAGSYASIFFTFTEILMAIIFVYLLHMGVYGIIITVSTAYLASIVILIFYARKIIKSKIDKQFLKKWLKLSWLPLYPSFSSVVSVMDAIIFSIIVGSVSGLGFWAAVTVGVILVTQSIQISRAVYPKLLQGGKTTYLQENFSHLFYFAIPSTAMAITFAKPGLFVLNPVYMAVVPVVVIVAVWKFFDVLGSVFQQYLTGMEKVDLNENSNFKDYVKSKLFLVPTLVLIQSVVYVILLVIGFLIMKDRPQLDLLIYWGIAGLITQIPFTIYYYLLVRKNTTVVIEIGRILKYVLVSIGVFGIIFLMTEKFLDYKQGIFEFLPNLFLFVLLGIGAYFAVTYFIDLRTKELFNAIIREIRQRRI